MAVETFVIQIVEKGGARTAKSIDRVGRSAKKAANIMASFRKALVLFSAVRAARKLVDVADAATRMENRLRASTNSIKEFNDAQAFISKLSRESRTDIEANANSYGRLLIATSSLEIKTRDLQKVQEALAFGVAVSGATAQEASSSFIQLTQGLASGAVQGQELRSVAEQLPVIAKLIEKEFGLAGGQLIAMGKANEGIFKTERVIKALADGSVELKEAFFKLGPTIAQGFTLIKNSAIEMIGAFNKSTGVIDLVAQAVIGFSHNIETITKLTLVLAIAWQVNLIVAFIAGNKHALLLARSLRILGVASTIAAVGQRLLNAAMNANPIILAVTAIATLVAVFIAFGDQLGITLPIMNFLKDTFQVLSPILSQIGASISSVIVPAWKLFADVISFVAPVIQAIGETIFSLVGELFRLAGSLLPVTINLQSMAPVLDFVAGALRVLGIAIEVIVRGALVAFVIAATAVVKVLNAMGLVSDKTEKKVSALAGAFIRTNGQAINAAVSMERVTGESSKSAESLDKAGVAARAASDKLRQVGDAAKQATGGLKVGADAANDNAKAHETLSEKIKRTNDNLNKLAGITSSAKDSATGFNTVFNNIASKTLPTVSSSAANATGQITALGSSFVNTTHRANGAAESFNNVAAAANAAASASASISGVSFSGGKITGSNFKTGGIKAFLSPEEIARQDADRIKAQKAASQVSARSQLTAFLKAQLAAGEIDAERAASTYSAAVAAADKAINGDKGIITLLRDQGQDAIANIIARSLNASTRDFLEKDVVAEAMRGVISRTELSIDKFTGAPALQSNPFTDVIPAIKDVVGGSTQSTLDTSAPFTSAVNGWSVSADGLTGVLRGNNDNIRNLSGAIGASNMLFGRSNSLNADILAEFDRLDLARQNVSGLSANSAANPISNLPGFRTGGSLLVGGSGAPDSRVAAMRVSPGERIDIKTPRQQRQEKSSSGDTFVLQPTFVMQGSNDGSRPNTAQIEKALLNSVRRARANGGR